MWIFVTELLLNGTNCIFRSAGEKVNISTIKFKYMDYIFNVEGNTLRDIDVERSGNVHSLSVSLPNKITDLQDGLPICLQQQLTGGFICMKVEPNISVSKLTENTCPVSKQAIENYYCPPTEIIFHVLNIGLDVCVCV